MELEDQFGVVDTRIEPGWGILTYFGPTSCTIEKKAKYIYLVGVIFDPVLAVFFKKTRKVVG